MNAKQIVGIPKPKSKKALLLISIVADEFGVDTEDIYIRSRASKYSLPRMTAMSIMRSALKLSWPSIAEHFNYKHHSSALNACASFDQKVRQDNDLKDTIINILKRYNEEK